MKKRLITDLSHNIFTLGIKCVYFNYQKSRGKMWAGQQQSLLPPLVPSSPLPTAKYHPDNIHRMSSSYLPLNTCSLLFADFLLYHSYFTYIFLTVSSVFLLSTCLYSLNLFSLVFPVMCLHAALKHFLLKQFDKEETNVPHAKRITAVKI